jgi:hypothetical protein
MTGKVLEFKRKDGMKPHYRSTDAPNTSIPVKLRTNIEIFQDVYEGVIADWQRFATMNKLNEYICGLIPSHVRGAFTDVLNDLNAISVIEQKLDMKVAVFYPGCTMNNPYGWLVAFHRGKEIYSTPPDMASEANARALNIILYLVFGSTMKTLGRD